MEDSVENCGSAFMGVVMTVSRDEADMKRVLRHFAGVLVVAACMAGCGELPAQAVSTNKVVSFKAGFAERDITPDIGMEMPGNYGKTYGRTIHDPCKVRAAVFDDGTKRVALVGIDALLIRRETVQAARRRIQERCGIPATNIMIGASHSHSSGPTGMILPGEFDHASAEVRQLAYEKSSTADLGYLKRVEQALVDAVCLANDFRVEAKCSFGSGREDKVSFNRRLRMKNGMTFSHPGRGNPDIFDYAAPIDPEVGVIGAWSTNGALLGVMVNFACHATASPPGFSANWIYYLEQTIRGAMGAQVPVVYLQGACGDITQVDNLSPYADEGGAVHSRRIGGSVGAEAVKVLLRAPAGAEVPLDTRSKVWKIKRRAPDPDKLRRSFETARKTEKEAGASEWTFAKETVLLDALIAKEPEVEVEAQAIQVGPAVFISNPAEYFVEFGLEIKRRSDFKFTYPVELANGCVGYVPTEEAFGPKGGGYETRLTSYSNLEPTAGRQFADTGVDLAKRMTPGKVPELPKAPPFTAPWSYGNNPPELK